VSNAVFPVLPGQTWPRVRVFQWPGTIKRANGRRYALSAQMYPTYLYRISYSFLRDADFAALGGFWLARGGTLDTFLFDDRDDDTATDQPFGIGDGTATAFQLVRSFGGYAEPVYEPVAPVVSVDGVPAANMLAPYGSFEVDSNADGLADGWTAYSLGTTGTVTYSLSSSGAAPIHGTWKQRIGASGLGTATGDRAGVVRVVNVNGAVPYTFSAYISQASAPATMLMRVDWYPNVGAGGTVISTSASSPIAPPAGVLTRYSLTATAPANARSAVLFVWMASNTAGPSAVTFDLDAVQFEAGSAAGAFSNMGCSVASGLVTFTAAPPAGAALTWSGQYYWRCAFTKDTQEFEEFLRRLRATRTLEFETVR